jgi:hypothetical protein
MPTAPKSTFKPSTTGEACIRRIVANDQTTHKLLLRCQIMQIANARKGRKSSSLDAELVRLGRSYNARQDELRQSRLLKMQQGMSADAKYLMDKFKSWFSVSGIGAFPLAAPLIIVGILVAGYLVLKAFGPSEKKSVEDVKAAAHLDERYKSMTPEQQQLFDETADKAGKAGYDKGQEQGMLTTGLLLVGAVLLVKTLGSGSTNK